MVMPLDHHARETLHQIAAVTYLDGKCYAFAIALNRGLRWPMLGLMVPGCTAPRHVAVYCSLDQKIYDVRGGFEQHDPHFGKVFGAAPPYTLKSVSEDDLRKVVPVEENTIATARKFAEAIWPEYPWISSMARRVKAFANDLEKISKKHGVYLRAPYPGVKPIVGDLYGDEEGYTIRPTDDGIAFTIDRRLER
jgi:hypothetical protein